MFKCCCSYLHEFLKIEFRIAAFRIGVELFIVRTIHVILSMYLLDLSANYFLNLVFKWFVDIQYFKTEFLLFSVSEPHLCIITFLL